MQLLGAGKVRVKIADAVPFASVRGRLLGADGQPQAGVAPVVQMLRSGSATLDGLRPGRWQLDLLMPTGGTRAPVFADVVAGETVDVGF